MATNYTTWAIDEEEGRRIGNALIPELLLQVLPVRQVAASSVPVYTFEDFMELGKDVKDETLKEIMNSQKPGNCCTLIYTSGTNGDPKAVMISHDNVVWTVMTVLGMNKHSFNDQIPVS
ncbi:hypothetical protein PC116_g30774 [Phytophthora cactorum]|nr:hypothetical protein PC111_g24297 [Phytophthora cactorum]KAG2792028.1 hypothetical protein PC112_g24024 [Phytophthora cactorum]KAG2805262.1 hypothetical protein PC113_g24249 [Phytophthora cactorum]KAG2873368.1 hypothetical protein PC115_g24377 [Phytophthora cactorum]KAG2956191.1 hypothetical protein PC118_g24576 [Phytophthora cactorum]